jgi:hypothetical protein
MELGRPADDVGMSPLEIIVAASVVVQAIHVWIRRMRP